jgi:hypothetical protein
LLSSLPLLPRRRIAEAILKRLRPSFDCQIATPSRHRLAQPQEEEMNTETTRSLIRTLARRLGNVVLVLGPTAVILVEVAGNRIP